MSKVAETEDYGGRITAIVEDNDYIYVGGYTNGYVVQYWKSNMTMKAEVYYNPIIKDIAQDDLYVYVGGQAQRVCQYLKSDMSLVAQTDLTGEPIDAISVNDVYVYANNLSTVVQYWKSNMTNTGISANYGNSIRKIVSDIDYVYVIGSSIDKVYQYWNLNMTKKAETLTYGDLYALTQDDIYIYAGGLWSKPVYQYWKSNMTKKAEASSSYGGEIHALTQDDLYVYAGGETTNKVCQYLKSDMSFVAESVSYGSTIYALSTSNDTHATGDTFSFNLTGLVMGTPYHYRAYANNSIGESYGDDKTFNTIAENLPPSFSNESPIDASLFQPISLIWNITIHDLNGDTFNWSIECSNGQSNSSNNDVNGSKELNISGLSYSTEYTVWVNATDGENANSATYTFTTFDGYYWYQATPNAEWLPRAVFGSLVFDNKMWIMGGTDGGDYLNDVWYSADGVNWVMATEHANWTSRDVFSSFSYDGKMWVIGGIHGKDGSDIFKDAWYSTDGVNWTLATNDTGMDGRAFASCIVYDGKMWIMGGDTYYYNLSNANDVWYSTDGVNWTTTGNAGWSGRCVAHMLVYDNKMWIMGGEVNPQNGLNDVWWSVDGANWTEATASADWLPRYFSSVAVYDNKMWIMGGCDPGMSRNFSDVWYSTDGATWTEQTDIAGWGIRLGQGSLVYNNHMWVIGGAVNGNHTNDTWYMDFIINFPPAFGTPSPTNGSIGQPLSLTWNITIQDIDGDTFDWTIECSNGQSNSSNNDVNGSKELDISGLSYSTEYTVWVNVTDGTNWTREWFTFNTMADTAPVLSSEYPINGSTDIPLSVHLHIYISDANGDSFNWTIQCSNGDTSLNTGEVNGTKYLNLTFPLSYSTLYYWWVNVTDGTLSVNETYNFTTGANSPPDFGTPSPVNGSTGRPLSFTWQIAINDPDGDTFDWSINCSNGDNNSASSESNGSKDISLSGLSYSTGYIIWVNATDGYNWTREWFTFTTKSNTPPVFGMPSPANGSTGQALSLTWQISIASTEGELFNWTIQCSNGQSSSANGASNGTKSLSISGLGYSTSYAVWVNATDSGNNNISNWTRSWFTFTTTTFVPPSNNKPSLSGMTPANNSVDVRIALDNVSVTIFDADTDLMDWSIAVSNGDSSSGVNRGNGAISCSLSSILARNATYLWWINVTDGTDWIRDWFIFNTTNNNTLPSITTVYPANNSRGIRLRPDCYIVVVDNDSDIMHVFFYRNATNGSWIEEYNQTGVDSNDTVYWNYTDANDYDENYSWMVVVNDSVGQITRIFNFDTKKSPTVLIVEGERDSDNDGLTDAQEAILGTNPNVVDTDGDGYSDYEEYMLGSDPLDPSSTPETVSNIQQINWSLVFVLLMIIISIITLTAIWMKKKKR